jgi:hypothetical protein
MMTMPCHPGAILGLIVALGAPAAAAPGRFFLLETDTPPQAGFAGAAYSEAASRDEELVTAPEARSRLQRAFPRLFSLGRRVDPTALEAELKAARGAHLSGDFAAAERTYARIFEDALEGAPEWLSASPQVFRALIDGAALRYQNALALKVPPGEALAGVERLLRRFPFVTPSPTAHPPEVMAVWSEVRARVDATAVPFVVNAHPLELERSGECALHFNGVEVASLPMAGPVGLPAGEHLFQVRCGAQVGWLTRVALQDAPVSAVVPVRAMMAARGDVDTSGVLLVDPDEGDAAALIGAISAAAGFQGATVARTAIARVEFGSWQAGMSGPTLEGVGTIRGGEIVDVRGVDVGRQDGRLWTWVTGGLGLATLGGALAANLVYEHDRKGGATAAELEGTRVASTALYVGAGALLATSVVLYFIEGAEDEARIGEGTVSFGLGSVRLRF